MMDASIAHNFYRLKRVKNHKNRGKWALGLSRDEPSNKQFGNVPMFLRYFTIARTRCWHGTALTIPDFPLFPSISLPFLIKIHLMHFHLYEGRHKQKVHTVLFWQVKWYNLPGILLLKYAMFNPSSTRYFKQCWKVSWITLLNGIM